MNPYLKFALTLAAIGGGAFIAKREYEKQLKTIKKTREEKKESLKKVGVDIETLENEVGVSDGENNLVKALYSGIAYNPEWDIDIIDTETFLDGTDGLIRVSQSRSNRGDDCLDIFFELPNYTKGSYNSPGIGDYITTICGSVEEMNTTLELRPLSKKLVAIAAVTYESPNFDGDTVTKYIELSPEVYKSYANNDRDGLSDFYEEVVNYGMKAECKELLAEQVGYNGDLSELRVNELLLMYKVIYPLKRINFESMLISLKNITNNLIVVSKSGKDGIEYRHLVFHAVNENGEFDMTYYYMTDENNHVCSESFVY